METKQQLIQTDERLEFSRFYANMAVRGLHYRERPAVIETFVMSSDYLNMKESVRPAVLQDLKELFSDYTRFAYCKHKEACFDEAIGTGKSYKTSIIISYILHHLLCMYSPQRDFRIDKDSLICIMNMSINALQARKVVFGEIKARIESSPWFLNHKPDPEIRSELRFSNHITVIPGHSGARFPLGYNLIAAVMDEAAFYTETQTHDVAEEMYYTLQRRIHNRFGDRGLLVMISSPRYIDDFIERKADEAKDNPDIFLRRHAIWDVLPDDIIAIEAKQYFEIDGVKIPLRYKKDFDKNADKAWRDLGARPSLVLEPYIKQYSLIEAGIDPNIPDPLLPDNTFQEWFKGEPTKEYYMHIDLSLTTDATGIAMAHWVDEENIRIDLMMRVKAKKGQEIDLSEIRAVVYALKARGFHIVKCTFDQFQSASSIQDFNKMGINSEKLSVDKDLACYETLKEGIYQSKVKYYRSPIFMQEMRRLELIKGKKVDHPAMSSKDVSDAVAGAVYNCVANKNLFSFGSVGQGKSDATTRQPIQKTEKDALKEAETLTQDGLVPYGFRTRSSY